jgi:hypothetical protein
VLLTRVIGRKRGEARSFVIVDAGMNDLIRPALYGAWHPVVPVDVTAAGRPPLRADVVGPVCESGDFLAQDRLLPWPEPRRAVGGARRGRLRDDDGLELQLAAVAGGGAGARGISWRSRGRGGRSRR